MKPSIRAKENKLHGLSPLSNYTPLVGEVSTNICG
jgi:hypothetical protein